MYDPGTLYVDPILTSLSVGYEDQTLFGLQIFPETPVRTQSGRYRVFDRSAWLVHESRREPGTVANEITGAKWSEDSFFTQEHSLQAPILDEERQELTSLGGLANPTFGGDLTIDPEADATEAVTGSILRGHEQEVANTVRNTANYAAGHTVTLSGTSQFDDYTEVTAGVARSIVSNPVLAIMTGMRKVYSATKKWPNQMVIPTMGMSFIENHPRIVERFQNFSLTDPEAFRKLTGFNGQILSVDSVYNQANNIDAAEDIVSFWGKDIALLITDKTPGQKTKTFGKTFAQLYPDGTTRPTDRWREQDRKADIVRTSYKWDTKVVSPNAGYLIKNAFSTGAF